MKPSTSLTVFDFRCDSFEELPTKMEEYVGYKVLPTDVWSINITEVDRKLYVILTIIYWNEKKVRTRNQDLTNSQINKQ